MTRDPVLVQTAAGVIGGVVTGPDGPPVAAAIYFNGWEGVRSGGNRDVAELAAELADLGIVMLRFDYPGLGESAAADRTAVLVAAREVCDWFLARTAGLPVLAFGYCFGVLGAADLAAREPRVIGIAGVSPPMPDIEARESPIRQSRGRKLMWILRRLPHLPSHVAARLRYGPPDSYRTMGDGERGALLDPAGMMRSIVRTTPLWILCGEDDASTPALRVLAEELVDEPRFELEVVDGVVYMSRTPATAAMRIRRSIEWARACLAPMEVSA